MIASSKVLRRVIETEGFFTECLHLGSDVIHNHGWHDRVLAAHRPTSNLRAATHFLFHKSSYSRSTVRHADPLALPGNEEIGRRYDRIVPTVNHERWTLICATASDHYERIAKIQRRIGAAPALITAKLESTIP